MKLALASRVKRSLHLSILQVQALAIIESMFVQADAHDEFLDSLPDWNSDKGGLPWLQSRQGGSS